MKVRFTKSKLMDHDIVVLRNGEPGLILKEEDVILYPAGMDALNSFTADLLFRGADCSHDIVSVYRSKRFEPIGFHNYKDVTPIFDREGGIVFIEDETITLCCEQHLKFNRAGNKKEQIQGLHAVYVDGGLRHCSTGSVREEEIDFILAPSPSEFALGKYQIDREILRIPGSDSLVILYDKTQEERIRNNIKNGPHMYYHEDPVIQIPKAGIEIYSNAIFCRMDPDGTLKSLEDDDIEVITKYMIL